MKVSVLYSKKPELNQIKTKIHIRTFIYVLMILRATFVIIVTHGQFKTCMQHTYIQLYSGFWRLILNFLQQEKRHFFLHTQILSFWPTVLFFFQWPQKLSTTLNNLNSPFFWPWYVVEILVLTPVNLFFSSSR